MYVVAVLKSFQSSWEENYYESRRVYNTNNEKENKTKHVNVQHDLAQGSEKDSFGNDSWAEISITNIKDNFKHKQTHHSPKSSEE